MSAAAGNAKVRIMALIEEIRTRLARLPEGPETEAIRWELDKMERIAQEMLK